jgi:hypothetical protein
MAKPFKTLLDKMSPKRKAAAKKQVKEMIDKIDETNQNVIDLVRRLMHSHHDMLVDATMLAELIATNDGDDVDLQNNRLVQTIDNARGYGWFDDIERLNDKPVKIKKEQKKTKDLSLKGIFDEDAAAAKDNERVRKKKQSGDVHTRHCCCRCGCMLGDGKRCTVKLGKAQERPCDGNCLDR